MALSNPGDLCACRVWDVQPECCCPDWPEPWPLPAGVPGEDLTPDQKRALWAQAAASSRLHTLTAFRWGLCEDVVRPCGPMECQPKARFRGWGWGGPLPYLKNGSMFNCVCDCACSDCDVRCTIPLPGPVNEVLKVTLDGVDLEEDVDWFVNAEGGLVRLNGCWPHTQDMRHPCGAEGSFCVRYLRGINPNADLGAIQAVSALACKLFHDACGDTCPSLRNASRVIRGNVEWSRNTNTLRNVEGIADRSTGIDSVDSWIDLVNPTWMTQVPRVLTPDVRKWKFRGVSERDRWVRHSGSTGAC